MNGPAEYRSGHATTKPNPAGVRPAPIGRGEWRYSAWVGLVVLLVMSPAVRSDFLRLWDDQDYVINNVLIRSWSFSNLSAVFTTYFVGNYAPVQMLSYMVDYSLWGLEPFGYHLVNVLLHALNASLVFILVRELGWGRPSALVAALIFGLHPTQVESVAWISQRKNVLAMTLALASFLSYIRSRRENRGLFLGLSLLFLCLSLLTKAVVVGLPLILLAADRCLLDHRYGRQRFSIYIPYVLMAIIGAAVNVLAQRHKGVVPYYGGSPWYTAMTMAGATLDYLRIILFPTSLSGVYRPTIETAIMNSRVIGGIELILGFSIWAIWCYRTGRVGAAFWSLWIAVTILPVSQIVPFNAIMADRYLYFPMIGIGVLFASAPGLDAKRVLPAAIAVLVLAAFGMLSLARIPVWTNDYAFWADTVRKTPSDPQSHLHYGYLLAERGDDLAAAQEYETALELDGSYFPAHQYLAKLCLSSKNDQVRNPDKALEHAGLAMALSRGGWPDIVDTWIDVLDATGRHEEAGEVLREALRQFPGNPLFVNRARREERGS